MRSKTIFVVLSILVFLSGCITSGAGLKKDNTIFSKEETRLILSGKANQPMRVLLVTNHEDSLILRTKSERFKVRKDDKILRHFTNRLYATVRDSSTRGVGIAAPQVGILKDIIWVQRFDKHMKPFEVYYNQVITKYSELKQDVFEGCLSIPDVRDTTFDRSYAVLLEYDDTLGRHNCEMIEAFTAAIFQHEIDHLNGILFTDHLKQEREHSIKHKIR